MSMPEPYNGASEMSENHTTAVVQRYLDALAEETSADPIMRAMLDRAVGWLETLCASMRYRSYPRLTRPPLSLQTDEVLGAVVERLLKAMRAVRPGTRSDPPRRRGEETG
jgi:RNA polymerase sigma-70 factor (ECF subfamily)